MSKEVQHRSVWREFLVIKLLRLLRKYPVLWNNRLPEYGNTMEKKRALEKIARQLPGDCSTEIVKRKIQTMRSQYIKEYRLMQSNRYYEPEWSYFHDFKFVFQYDDKYNKLKRYLKDIASDEDKDDDDEGDKDDDDEEDKDDDDEEDKDDDDEKDEDTQSLVVENSLELKHEPSISMEYNDAIFQGVFDKPVQNDESHPTASFDNVLACMPQKSEADGDIIPIQNEMSESRDKFAVFGENIANELRSLNEYPSIQLAFKCKVLRALTEANEELAQINK